MDAGIRLARGVGGRISRMLPGQPELRNRSADTFAHNQPQGHQGLGHAEATTLWTVPDNLGQRRLAIVLHIYSRSHRQLYQLARPAGCL